MNSYHVRLARVDAPTVHVVGYFRAKTVHDAIAMMEQRTLREKPGEEYEFASAQRVWREPTRPSGAIARISEDAGGHLVGETQEEISGVPA